MLRILAITIATLVVTSCAKGGAQDSDAAVVAPDASCGEFCDRDQDGVVDSSDQCPDTPPGKPVNLAGCAETQLPWKLEPTFPPFGLMWTPTGDLGRAGGLTWTYTNIERKDLFHIDWIVCDDPALACGLSLDGPIDVAAESWQVSAADSALVQGKLVFTNATQILLASGGSTPLTGRLTLTIVDATNIPIQFAGVASLGVTARVGQYGAEIKGTGFKVVALAEVKDAASAWTPYLDYYDAAPTPTAGGGVTTSFGGWFYDK